ncbi:MAG: flagellar basal body P-ring formation chaperone FlgA [Rhodobacteraceae bacterium]|nr:flagellar basal body P-ring formation chaperone FlgA [Paracoccaceae bacterium]MCF8513445.1 flagellar basal body P-ring formation chaperone FlgA [Paracoccaceae bacterium]
MVRRFLLVALLLPTPQVMWAEAPTASMIPAEQAVAIATKALREAGITGATPIAPSHPLPACNGPILASPRQGTWATIVLNCDGPQWTRSLRTRAGSQAPLTASADRVPAKPNDTARQAIALIRTLGKGEVIGPKDIALIPVSDQTPEQVFSAPDDLIGRRLKQAMAPGKVISPRHLEPDWMVEKDGPVLIVSQAGGISLSVKGRALESAAFGELVSVASLSSGRTLNARVIGQDIVSVALKPLQIAP